MQKVLGLVLIVLALIGFVKGKSSTDTKTTGNAAYNRSKQLGKTTGPIVIGLIGLVLLVRGSSQSRSTQSSGGGHFASAASGPGGYVASNEAGLKMNWARTIICSPAGFLIGLGLFLLGVLTFFLGPRLPGLVLVVASGIYAFISYGRAALKFFQGDVCPGIVIGEKPWRVAVLTDLCPDGGPPKLAVQVCRFPLRHMTGGPPFLGMRLATVALYKGPIKNGAWSNFMPEAINCAVSDEAEIQRVFQSIPEDQWATLDAFAAQISDSPPGMYRLWGDGPAQFQKAMSFALQNALAVVILSLVVVPVMFAIFSKPRHPSVPAGPGGSPPMVRSHESTPPAYSTRTPPAIRSGDPESTPPVAPPNTTRRVIETPSIPTPESPATASLSRIELGGKITTFSNLEGRVYTDVKLLYADRRRLYYSSDGGGGSIALNVLPPDLLTQLGIPTSWSSKSSATTSATADRAFQPGDAVVANWGGKWQPGTVVTVNRSSVQVRFQDPKYRIPFWLGTNLVRFAQ